MADRDFREWAGQIPIRIVRRVESEIPLMLRAVKPGRYFLEPGDYMAHFNRHGAVSAPADAEHPLGLKPLEFQWLCPCGVGLPSWHDGGGWGGPWPPRCDPPRGPACLKTPEPRTPPPTCDECGGAGVQFRGSGKGAEYRVCSRYQEWGHPSGDEIRARIAAVRGAACPSGRTA